MTAPSLLVLDAFTAQLKQSSGGVFASLIPPVDDSDAARLAAGVRSPTFISVNATFRLKTISSIQPPFA